MMRRFQSLLRRAPLAADGSTSIGPRQIYILPTKVGVAYGGLLFATLLGALNYQNNLGLLLTFLMIGVSVVSMHHTWFNLLRLRVRAQPGAPVFCGQPALFRVLLEDTRQRPRPGIGIVGGGSATLAAGTQATLELTVPTRQRGPLALKEVTLETYYPLALFRAWCIAQVDAEGLVYPAPAPYAAAPPQRTSIDHNGQGDQGTGAEDYVGPRSYALGDSLRRVDWKALARERGLIVKHFGGDCAARVWLDWAQLPPVDDETRIQLLCRQVLDAAEQNIVYGLRLPGQSIDRAQGDAHKHRCLAALARFRYGE